MVDITFKFEAFSFTGICETVALPLCPLIGQKNGIEPVCYSRNIDLAGNLIFQPGKKSYIRKGFRSVANPSLVSCDFSYSCN